MHAIICKKHGLPDTLTFENTENPKVGTDDVLINVAACSVNFPDVLIIQNKYQFKPELPFSPGGEIAGIVTEIGENVKNIKVGQKVLALCGWGGFAEFTAVDQSKVFPVPSQLDFVTAAALMYNYGTSYHALKNRAKLKPGETLLVLGAAGGVGLAAVELGKVMGATVIAAASNAEKLAVCKSKGADFLINYEDEDLKTRVKEITQGKGVDVIYDPVGDKFTEPALRSIAWKGRYLVVGFAAGEIPKIPLNLALLKGCAIVGVFWGQFAAQQPKDNLENLKELAQFFIENKIKPYIYKKYLLSETIEALNDLANRKVKGKAVVICNPSLVENEKVEDKKQTFDGSDKKIENHKLVFKNFDEVIAHVGQDLGKSKWHTVSQSIIDDFARTTKDDQWIHTDPVKARKTAFGQTIAHGLLTLSLSPVMLNEIYEINNVKMGINYGSDKVRYLQPVLSGAKLKMEAKLLEALPIKNKGLKMKIEANYYVENQPNPVCISELISVLYEME